MRSSFHIATSAEASSDRIGNMSFGAGIVAKTRFRPIERGKVASHNSGPRLEINALLRPRGYGVNPLKGAPMRLVAGPGGNLHGLRYDETYVKTQSDFGE